MKVLENPPTCEVCCDHLTCRGIAVGEEGEPVSLRQAGQYTADTGKEWRRSPFLATLLGYEGTPCIENHPPYGSAVRHERTMPLGYTNPRT